MSYAIYERAVGALRDKCGEIADRDRIKVVQLFDRLLAKGHSIHVDELRRLCRDAGYNESTADDIAVLYDDFCLIRGELNSSGTVDYWPAERVEQIISG